MKRARGCKFLRERIHGSKSRNVKTPKRLARATESGGTSSQKKKSVCYTLREYKHRQESLLHLSVRVLSPSTRNLIHSGNCMNISRLPSRVQFTPPANARRILRLLGYFSPLPPNTHRVYAPLYPGASSIRRSIRQVSSTKYLRQLAAQYRIITHALPYACVSSFSDFSDNTHVFFFFFFFGHSFLV